MIYTIAEFRKHTRRILNEAMEEPITITRYDDAFVLMLASRLEQPKPLPTDIKPESLKDLVDPKYEPSDFT